ncbi:ABC transporter permease [Thiomicrorhabdus heinhorstiae]|uniref:ABC transporter permease subunit n=1 Tax=Thiomicrorhabdus heinhorstiae TaxID=2748010 RepID=A0ABS0BZS2_9GAMM|nr:ABC transporter permease subunit [Thiomicrorhabdus heinhorstiae]MBF6058550.1 ABC transporter permease subunit [Thiomicrorhabdus heinhorstiae]
MKKVINQTPGPIWGIFLGLLPLILIVVLYAAASDARLLANPGDKLLPGFDQMWNAFSRMALEPSKRTGEYLLWVDTYSSMIRLLVGVLIAAILGMFLGILLGSLPYLNAGFSPLLTVTSLVPPLAILPILLIIFGVGEVSKIVLIAIGITPFIARDIQRSTQNIPREQLIKAQTLGANSVQMIFRVITPQMMPKLIDAVRLSLGAAWLFLIAAEAIASTNGLGYRIFLVRRYMSMDIIIPYVVWITLLSFLMDILLAKLNRWFYPWHFKEQAKND